MKPGQKARTFYEKKERFGKLTLAASFIVGAVKEQVRLAPMSLTEPRRNALTPPSWEPQYNGSDRPPQALHVASREEMHCPKKDTRDSRKEAEEKLTVVV